MGEDHLVLKVDESLLGRLEWNGGKARGIGGFVVSSQGRGVLIADE